MSCPYQCESVKVKDKLKKGLTIPTDKNIINLYLFIMAKIIYYSSVLQKGEIFVTFNFDDDTDVFLTNDGYECVNYNNIHPDAYYIEIAEKFYNSKTF